MTGGPGRDRDRRPTSRWDGAGRSKAPRSRPIWRPAWRRGLPTREPEDPYAAGAGAPAEIGGVLDSLLQRGPWSAGLALGDLARRWDQVVGDALAAATEPVRLQDGVLSVRASTQAWAAQVRFLAPTVRARANEALGRSLVQDVRVFVGEGSRG